VPAGRDGRSAVGERLRDAGNQGDRSLPPERDTKIPSKYLAALEDGDFTDFPGTSIHALHPATMRPPWPRCGRDRRRVAWRGPVPPDLTAGYRGTQPLTIRRGIVFQRSHGVIAVVLIIILVVASYFGFQLTRYLSYPTLAGDFPTRRRRLRYPSVSTSYVLKGSGRRAPGRLISWNGQDPNIVIHGRHRPLDVPGRPPGRQQRVRHHGKNLDTIHASPTRKLIVPGAGRRTPNPALPEIGVSTPKGRRIHRQRNTTLTGISTESPRSTLTPRISGLPLAAGASSPRRAARPRLRLRPRLRRPRRGAIGKAILLSPSPTPGQSRLRPDVRGRHFTFSLTLTPGKWKLSIVENQPEGRRYHSPLAKRHCLPFTSVSVLIQIKGGAARPGHLSRWGHGQPGLQPEGRLVRDCRWQRSTCALTRPGLSWSSSRSTACTTAPSSTFGGHYATSILNGPKNHPK